MSDTPRPRLFQARPVHYGASAFLLLAGEFDMAGEEQFAEALDGACWERPSCLVLDLSELSFIDSTGLHSLLLALRRTEEDGIELAVVPSRTPHVMDVLRISGIDRLLPLAADGVAAEDAMTPAA
jgi:anti-anti-sigma factor